MWKLFSQASRGSARLVKGPKKEAPATRLRSEGFRGRANSRNFILLVLDLLLLNEYSVSKDLLDPMLQARLRLPLLDGPSDPPPPPPPLFRLSASFFAFLAAFFSFFRSLAFLVFAAEEPLAEESEELGGAGLALGLLLAGLGAAALAGGGSLAGGPAALAAEEPVSAWAGKISKEPALKPMHWILLTHLFSASPQVSSCQVAPLKF